MVPASELHDLACSVCVRESLIVVLLRTGNCLLRMGSKPMTFTADTPRTKGHMAYSRL